MCAEFSVCSLNPGGTLILWAVPLFEGGTTAVIEKEFLKSRVGFRRTWSGGRSTRRGEARM